MTVPPTLQLLCVATLYNNRAETLSLLPRRSYRIIAELESQVKACISKVPKRHYTAFPRVKVRIRKLRTGGVLMGSLCIGCHNEWDYK